MEVKFYAWGKRACFSTPLISPNRMSYPIITPPSIRYLMGAIHAKPEQRWIPVRLRVLKMGTTLSLRTNEVTKVLGKSLESINTSDCRAQRNSLILCDVAYEITAESLLVKERTHGGDANVCYAEQFNRNLKSGRLFRTPYFGCREFTANVSLEQPFEQECFMTTYMGGMILENECRSGKHHRDFFECSINNGVVDFPVQQIKNFWRDANVIGIV